jgi:hypothetical protein
MSFRVISLAPELVASVRRERRSPQFGHPAIAEVATGTGPCRSCLRLFEVGREERLLFTHRPTVGPGTPGAPGPVFVHAADCDRFEGDGFPDDLRRLPIIVEGRTGDGRVLRADLAPGAAATALIEATLADPEVEFLFLRHGEAGCHIARAERWIG